MGNKFNPPQERVYILDTNVFGLIAEGNPAVLADLQAFRASGSAW